MYEQKVNPPGSPPRSASVWDTLGHSTVALLSTLYLLPEAA